MPKTPRPGSIRLYCKRCNVYRYRKPNTLTEWVCDICDGSVSVAPYTKLADNQIEKAKRDLAELNQ